MSLEADTVVIVEPYRSGSHLADIAMARGFRCILTFRTSAGQFA
jgi:hypothetical protein